MVNIIFFIFLKMKAYTQSGIKFVMVLPIIVNGCEIGKYGKRRERN